MEKQELESMVNLLKAMPTDEQKFVYGVILGVSGNLAGVSGKPPRKRECPSGKRPRTAAGA